MAETNIPKPDIRLEKGYVCAEAIVGMNYGICARPALAIANECNRYHGKVFIKRPEQEFPYRKSIPKLNELEVDAKSIMNLLSLVAAKGVKLEVRVEGEDEEAKRLLTRLCSGLTSLDSFDLNFNRFLI